MYPLRMCWLVGLALVYCSVVAGQTTKTISVDAAATPLPDVLRFDNGLPVINAADWKQRRQEMLATLTTCFIGTVPPPPGNVVFAKLDARLLQKGRVHYERFRLVFGPDHELGFNVALFRPADTLLRPIIVHPSFYPTPGDDVTGHLHDKNVVHPEYADPEHAAVLYTHALNDGYAIVVFNYQQCAADHADARSTGFLRAYPNYTWGGLSAWAWGMSRCVDFLESQPGVDRSRILAVGHSRLGKVTLIAGVLDDRFALVAPAGAGCGGTGAFRFCGPGRGGKEGIESYVAHFPWQVTPHFLQFAKDVYRLPFDQNWLIALVAPRPFIAADSYDDQYCNSNGLLESITGARPAYDLLHADSKLAVHFRHGPHALTNVDWDAILKFANIKLGSPPR